MFTFRTTEKEHRAIKKLLHEIKKTTGQKISMIILKALETYKKFIQ